MRTLKIRIPKTHKEYSNILEVMTEYKRLYNSCLFFSRLNYFRYLGKEIKPEYLEDIEKYELQEWFDKSNYNGNKFAFDTDFTKKVCANIESKLMSKQVQTVVRQLSDDWRSYFNLKGIQKRRRIPNYKSQYMSSSYNLQMISKPYLRKGLVKLTQIATPIAQLPTWLKEDMVQSCELKYNLGSVWLNVIYKNKPKKATKLNPNRVVGLDPGSTNLATLVFNFKKKPITLKNNKLRSYNQWYNKQQAKIKSDLDKHNLKTSHRLDNLLEKRNLRIDHELNVVSNFIVAVLIQNKVGTVVVGKNKGWKTGLNLGKRNNQNFTQLPIARLISKLTYKCEEVGIKVVEQEESYTSKASFIELDEIPTFNPNDSSNHTFSGKRTKRGLYKSKHHYIHSDVNGAANILRKAGFQFYKIRNNWLKYNNIQPVGIYL